QPQAGLGADPARGNGAFMLAGFDTTSAPAFSSDLHLWAGANHYQLLKNGLRVTLPPAGGQKVEIPLAVDPWRRLEPGWKSRFITKELAGGWQLGWEGGPMVSVTASGRSVPALESFFDAIPLIQSPENPNVENPPGIYLPFGLSLITFSAENALTIEITLAP
ncbi:MAG TPA: hypothetical protein VFM46_13060, partial [Pseudomonadales bacterium]|nr:hypothetical protein [Pseudomonadales bacterium]